MSLPRKPSMVNQLERSWTVYVIHHSHTDLGYTETPRRITRYHCSYIDLLLDAYENDFCQHGRLKSFRWTNECFWSIEQWLNGQEQKRIELLLSALRDGFIGLTSNYLHFTEMIDADGLAKVLDKARSFAEQHSLPMDTALHADINGYSWGYSQALYDSGTRNLISMLHSVHGHHPIKRAQVPFWWETPKGDALLVWNGEQYMLGNVLGLAPGAMLNYVFQDENRPTINDPDNRRWAEIRLPRYLRQLEMDGYPVNYTMLGVGGTLSDNDPPNFAIAEFIDDWNADYGDQIRLEMVTPSEFMAKVHNSWPDIPRYGGDWPDWWSDGVASMPLATRLCRSAQRTARRLDALDTSFPGVLNTAKRSLLNESIALYCEHTFGHSDSVKTPWVESTQHIALLKKGLAAEALSLAKDIEDDFKEKVGEAPMMPFRTFKYLVYNPFDEEVSAHVPLYLEYCDHHVRDISSRIIDCVSGEEIPSQREESARGYNFLVSIKLAANEAIQFELCEGFPTARYCDPIGTDAADPDQSPRGICYGALAEAITDRYCRLEHVELEFDSVKGLVGLTDTRANRSLLAEDAPWSVFTPVYERTELQDPCSSNEQMKVRARMGRNRKGQECQAEPATLKKLKLTANGPLRVCYELCFEMPGASVVVVQLDIYKDQPRMDVLLRMNKDSVWNPENVYFALPLQPGESGELWLEKAGAWIRPGIDQLPGSLTDYYCLQSGYVVCGEEVGIAVSCLDAPLLQLGSLNFGLRELAWDGGPVRKAADAFGWLMTNYWETNFEASVGGFHEFRYRVTWGTHLSQPERAFAACRQLGNDPLVIRGGNPEKCNISSNPNLA